MSNFGYSHGNPFGDPDQFTRSTGEDEIDRFNQWMRAQPWWAAVQHNPNAVQQHLAQMGIQIPDAFHIDEAGNINQKSRVKRNLAIAGLAGAAALTGGGALGFGPLAGVMGGATTATSAGAIPALEGGGTLAANLAGTAALPAAFGGAAAGGAAAAIPGFVGPTLEQAGLAGGSEVPNVVNKVKDAVTHASGTTGFLKDLALLGGGNFLSGLGDSLFHQQRQSFKGTAADPVNVLSGVQRRIEGAAGPLADRAFTPPSISTTVQPVTGLSGRDPGMSPIARNTEAPMGPSGGADDLAHLQQVFSLFGRRA